MRLSVQKPTAVRKAALAITIDGMKWTVPPTTLHGSKRAEMLARCRQAQKPIKVRIDHLLDLPDNDRFMALDLVREIGECQVFVNEVKQLGLLDGTLALMNNSPDIERARRGKMAALEAAVLTCPDALDLQCSRIKERMKAIGIKGIQQRDLERDARNILQHLSGPFHN